MSAPMNSGTIIANKPFTEEAVAIIEDILGKQSRFSYYGGYALEKANIEFYEYYTYDLEEFLANIVDRLKPLGFTLTGSVEYFGDWGDGRIDVDGDDMSSLAREDFALHDADDDTLIEMLSQRGYTVTKNSA